MRKIKVIISLLLIFTIYLGINYSIVYASFADFDDKTAEQQTQKLEEKQKKELENIQNKSKNNYLDSLEVVGYKLEPEFDKQIQEYKINGEIKDSKITIKAKANDSKAKVSGIGEVKVSGNSTRIDVTAESGTVRTYIIKFSEEKEKSTEENTQESISNIETENFETETVEPEKNNENKSNVQYGWYIIGGIIILLIIVLIVIIVVSKKKNGKHF